VRVVFDTNVLVSALLKRNSVSARAIELALTERVRPLFDARIIAEYRDVLKRPRFGFPSETVQNFLEDFQDVGELILQVEPFIRPVPDRSDLPFIEVAISGRAHAIVTGNSSHYPRDIGISLFSPAELVERLSLFRA
jgi:uncharacterized protein